MYKKLVLLSAFIVLAAIVGNASAGTLFTENFGTSAFTKTQWTETNASGVSTNVWLGDTSLPPSTTGYSAKLTSNSVSSLLTMTNGINTTGAKEVIITLWVKRLHASTDYVDLWANSSSAPNSYTSIANFMTDTINTWTSHTITLTADSYMFNGFKIRLRGRTNGGTSGTRNVWYDEISISTTYQAISGSVGTLEGVLMEGLPGNPVTGVGGAYTANVGYNWTGTVTPVLAGYAFNPVNRTYSNVITSQTAQDYTPSEAVVCTVSGSVGTLDGVTMAGLPGSPVTSGGGAYIGSVNQGWSGTVTPTKAGYTFSPVNKTYSDVDANVAGENYSPDPTKANTSSPVNGFQYGKAALLLSWIAGNMAVSHDVYFGTDFDDVNDADGGALCVSPEQSGVTYDPTLEYDTTYYWRIDENYNTGFETGTLKGDVWSFKTIEESAADPNLLGWWKLDDATTGAKAWDCTGNGHHGTFTAGAAIANDATRGNVVSLDGTDDYVLVSGYKNVVLGSKPRSICAWIKTSKTGYQGIAAWGSNNTNQSWDFVVYSSKLRQMIYNTNRSATTIVADGNWHHVATVYAGGNINTVKLYVDGVNETVSGDSATPNTVSSRSFMIGNTDSLSNRFFQGMISDVRLYNRALSEVEVRAGAGNSAACEFSPANGALTLPTVLLDWESSAASPKYNLYLSSDFNDVNDMVPSALKGDGITDSNFLAEGLELDTIYYWAVDVNDGGTMYYADTIVSFHTAKPYADTPLPPDGAKYLPTNTSQLSWAASSIMIDQDVYFGTNSGLVEGRDNDCLIADNTTASSTTNIGTLANDTTYYWLVDTNSTQGVSSLGVWSFTTATAITDPNLVGLWTMDSDDDATYAWDHSGYGHYGTLTGNAAIIDDPCGVRGKILALDGTGDYLNLGNGAWTNPGDHLTIAVWFKVNAFPAAQYYTIIAKSNKTYRIARDTTANNQLCTNMNFDSSGYRDVIADGININDGQWHHVAASYDGTVMKIYIDGTEEDSDTLSTLFTNTSNLCIGRNVDNTPRDWNGWIDEVRFYNRALTSEEIMALAGSSEAFNFSPSYGAVTAPTVLLDWDCLAASPLYNVYLDTNSVDVTNRLPGTLVDEGITDSNFLADDLDLSTVYYWAVDVNNNGTIFAGSVMSFTTANTSATNPSPVNGAKYVVPTQLSWTASAIMTSQDVYFGTNLTDVNSRDNDCLIADDITASNTANIGTLVNGVTYYWLVDTNSSQGINSMGLWSFTAAVITDPTLIGWWKFDDDAGAQAWDYSGYGHHGTMSNTAFVDGKLGKALNFVRASLGYVSIPSAAVSGLSSQVTISLWAFGGEALPAQTSVFNAEDSAGTRVLNAHLPWSSTGTIYWDAGCSGTAYDRINKIATENEYKGQWNHWAFTKEATTGQMKVYLNGSLWNSGTGMTKSMSGITRFAIGSKSDGTSNHYDGIVDDFRVYNRVLSGDEIKVLAGDIAAYNFSPANAAVTPTTVLLDWDCSAVSPLYNVYMDTNSANVTNRVPGALVGDGITDSNYPASELALNTTYYWAVDVSYSGTIFASAVRNFKTVNASAENPSPANGMQYVVTSQLSWTASSIMTSQDVYFGTNSTLVEGRDNDCLIADDTTASSTTNIGTLADDTTYYWLVDTNSSEGIKSMGVWNFTTSTAVADSNLIGWWKMDSGDDATHAWDYSGYGHNGTLTGNAAVVDDPCGVRGKILALDGAGDYVNLGNGAWTNPGNHLTIAVWFKVNAFPAAQFYTIIAKGNETYRIARDTTSNNQLCTNMNYEAGSGHYKDVIADGVNINDGQWHHVAASYNGTQMKIYIDGSEEDSDTLSTLWTTTANLCIGRNVDATARDWNGWVDDVRLYNKALSQKEIWIAAGINPPLDNLRKVVANWLTTGASDGDLNSDGIVDLLDFNKAVQQWGGND